MQDKNLVSVNLASEMKTSFIDYAMSVIVARALTRCTGRSETSASPYSLRDERVGCNP
jgi:hypothetical protein